MYGKNSCYCDSHYYRISDISHGPKVTFLLFYSRYNKHLRHTKWHILLFVWESTLTIGSCTNLKALFLLWQDLLFSKKEETNIAQKKYRAVIQNLKSVYFHCILLLGTLVITDFEWRSWGCPLYESWLYFKIVDLHTCTKTQEKKMMTQTRRKKWNWIGHMSRKPHNNVTKQALFWNPQGKRNCGRPQNNWRRSAEQELRQIGLQRSETERQAQDRDQWKKTVDELCST